MLNPPPEPAAAQSALVDVRSRARRLAAACATEFDIAIIGGGVTGVAIARLAGRCGLRVVLAESNDFASGTSSRSSKLIHGGIRYLQNFEIGLVGATARERKEVHRLAPHLAQPRWMVLPARHRAQLAIFRAAVSLYEWLGEVAPADHHQVWNRQQLAQREPLLRRDRLPWAVAYREYVTDDARLVVALARDAARHGAELFSHSEVHALDHENGRIAAMHIRCGLTGASMRLRAKVFVNAAGPWVDRILQLETPSATPMLRLSSGIHLVFCAKDLPVQNLLMLAAADKRRYFALRREQVVHVGTTDQPHQQGPQHWPSIADSDVDYLLDALPASLDHPRLTREHVRGAWSGLRPLVASGSGDTTSLSRSDEIRMGPAGMVTIAGGKLTGFPGMARKTMQVVAQIMNTTLQPRGVDEPLPGAPPLAGPGEDAADALQAQITRAYPHLATSTIERLVRLYGTDAALILQNGSSTFAATDICQAEVAWAIAIEGASDLEDVLYRRLRAPFYASPAREKWPSICAAVAQEMALLLEWSAQERQEQIERVLARLQADLELPQR